MINVSLFINSSKMRDAVVSNFDLERVKYSEENQWSENSDILFNVRNDLIIIDFNTIKNETLDVFLAINSLCGSNGIKFILLVKRKSDGLRDLERNLSCLQEIVETHTGRKDFDRALRRIISGVAASHQNSTSSGLDESQKEIHIPLEDKGNINDTAVFNLLFAVLVRKATGVLSLVNGARSRSFCFRGGAFVDTDDSHDSFDLVDAMAWKTGTYTFEKHESLAGRTKPVAGILASGIRDSISSQDAMRPMMTDMKLFPALTSRFEDSRQLRDSMPELSKFSKFFERGMTWEQVIAEESEEFFKVAYFALNTFLVDSANNPNTRISISWSQATRKALERGERRKIEKTTAFKTAQNPENVEKELRVKLRDMEYETAYEIFGVWEGCGRNVVRDRFYELVKQRHPDIYGNVSISVKGYAQKIFIGVKNAYTELLTLEKFDEVSAVGEPSFVIQTEVSEIEEIAPEAVNRGEVPPPRTRSVSDVQTKMGQLSAMRKKRSRRRSLAETKSKLETPVPRLQTETERILSEISETGSSPLESSPVSQPSVAEERQNRFEQLKNRARKKNPNAISEAQELFSEGYQLYRENRIALAHEKFEAANTLDSRALHLAFFAYTSFLVDDGNAEKSEMLVRKAIEMNDKQTQPDALFFMAQILKYRGDLKNALSFYEKAFVLNPTNREAEREIRLSRLRNVKKNTDSGDFIKNLFKK